MNFMLSMKHYLTRSIILECPDKPGIPEPLEVGDDFVTLHWQKPEFDGNSQPLTYTLEYRNKKDTA